MGTTTFSGPVKSGTVKEGASVNVGSVVLSQTNTLTFANTTAKNMFILPANSQIIDCYVLVTTAFNSSGTDNIDIGKTGTANQFADDVGGGTLAANTIARGTSQLSNWLTVGTSDVQVTATYVQGVADATTGAATVVINYIQN